MKTITKKDAVNMLVANDIDAIQYTIAILDKIPNEVSDILLNGFIGYNNMSIDEINEEIEKWFGDQFKVEL